MFDDFRKVWQRGRTHRLEVTITQPDTAGVLQPVDPDTLGEIAFTAKRGWDDATPAIHVTKTGGQITTLDRPKGMVLVEVPDDQMAALPNALAYLWAEIAATQGAITWPVATGTIVVTPVLEETL